MCKVYFIYTLHKGGKYYEKYKDSWHDSFRNMVNIIVALLAIAAGTLILLGR